MPGRNKRLYDCLSIDIRVGCSRKEMYIIVYNILHETRYVLDEAAICYVDDWKKCTINSRPVKRSRSTLFDLRQLLLKYIRVSYQLLS
jgi:hypothetical protein